MQALTGPLIKVMHKGVYVGGVGGGLWGAYIGSTHPNRSLEDQFGNGFLMVTYGSIMGAGLLGPLLPITALAAAGTACARMTKASNNRQSDDSIWNYYKGRN
jgi:hypothetical protein